MKNIKILIIALLTLIIPIGFCACGSDEQQSNEPTSQTQTDNNLNTYNNNTDEIKSNIEIVPGLFDNQDNCIMTWDEITKQYPSAFTQNNKIVANDTESYLKNLEGYNLIISSTITDIDDYSFKNCTKIKNIYMQSVTKIGDFAFDNCTLLETISIPASTTEIGDGIVMGCNNISNIYVNNDNSKYLNESSTSNHYLIEKETKTIIAFANKSVSNGQLVIPSDSNIIKKIGNNAFQGNDIITSVTIPNNIEYIGKRAFMNCTNLESVIISGSVKTIDEYAFSSCNKISSLTLNEGITNIEKFAFSGCTMLSELILPNSATNLEYCCFANCTNLTNAYIGSSVSRIYISFFNSNSINNVTINSESVYNQLTSINDCGYLISHANSIKVLKTIVDDSNNINDYLNNTLNYTQTENENYYVYTKNA